MNVSEAVKTTASGPPTSGRQQFKRVATGKPLDNAVRPASGQSDSQNRKQTQPPTHKAWQGPNPITQRSAANTPNGLERPRTTPKSNGTVNGEKLLDERMTFLLANMKGSDVTVTLHSGERFSGIFSSASHDSPNKPQYLLKMVKRLRGPAANGQHANGQCSPSLSEYVGEGPDYTMRFDMSDTVLDANGLSLASTTATRQNGTPSTSFRTDTEISSRDTSKFRERELQRWEPNGEIATDLSLDSSSAAGWDQFAANESKFGVQSTYDEDIYTTSIDRNDPRYRQREARAAQIAREIELSTPADAHVAEERIVNADKGDGLDEEQKYSGVIRDQTSLPKRGANSYVPPSQRPITSAPTVAGAPFDPAIVSMTKQSPLPSISESRAPVEELKIKPLPTPTEAATNAPAPSPSTASTATMSTTTAAPSRKSESTTEDHVRSTADAFRLFANGEKLRVRQAQEQKRSNARAEKNVKLNDLKKFAQNFKLNSRVPDDLIPILAKTRDKQLEIQRKAEEAAKEQELKVKEKEKATASVSPAAPAMSSNFPAPSDSRPGISQHSRNRVSQNLRAPVVPNQAPPSRNPITQQRGSRGPVPVPIPTSADPRIPTGPAASMAANFGPAAKLNVNAFEFRPSASNFTPANPSPSPQRKPASPPQPPRTFFAEGKTAAQLGKITKDTEENFNVIKHLTEEVSDEQKKTFASNGGIPQPYRTGPTWPVETANQNTSYKDSFPRPQGQSVVPSTQLPAGPANHNPHAHQLPVHLQAPQGAMPGQRPFYNGQMGQNHGFDPRMQHFAPAGSVQSSPRFPQAQMAYNGHMQQPMPQFNAQPMPGYHMSPSMQFRQMQMPGAAPAMMMPNQQMSQFRNGYPQGQHFGGQHMGGQMMAPNPSGGYMNGPMPQPQGYSPMPPHAQPHMSQMHPGGPANFGGGPRPPMMQHSGSHQGFQPPVYMQQQPAYSSSPGQSHPYHLQHQQRQMSANQFPQMTPRQQAAIPQHTSPGTIPTGQGDEGK